MNLCGTHLNCVRGEQREREREREAGSERSEESEENAFCATELPDSSLELSRNGWTKKNRIALIG